MALTLVAIPLAAAVLGLCLGRSRTAAAVVAIGGAAAALVAAVVLSGMRPWQDIRSNSGLSGDFQPLPFSTTVDGLSVTVALMVCFIALMVQIYSVGYMRGKPRYASYSAFISLFTSAMLAVVVAGDLLFLIVGWEVMGLCSYLLIGQHWERPDAQRAAIKAFLVTKVGDVGFIVGIVVLIGATGTLLLPEAVAAASREPTVATVVSLLLFLGVMGKSAQFPLHAWLPDAMAGPSPVSALIHAATMVAAGVYVIARMFPMFAASELALSVMAVVACITMVGAAVAAIAQEDLKRVLAWSTVSQLAYMVAALAIGARDAAVFHLLSHAFFKALLFLGAGVVIHAVGSNYLREMGGLRKALPITFGTMSLALLALVGVFPLAGFFSKEAVLVAAEHAAAGEGLVSSALGWLVFVSCVLTIALTAIYAGRLWVLTFLGPLRVTHVPAVSKLMTGVLVVLAVPTVAFGVLGLTAEWLPTWAQANLEGLTQPQALMPELLTVLASVAAVAVGVLLVWLAARRGESSLSRMLGGADGYALRGFGVDIAYQKLAVVPFRSLVHVTMRTDASVIGRTVRGVGRLAVASGGVAQQTQRGDVQRYLTATLAAVVLASVLILVAVAT